MSSNNQEGLAFALGVFLGAIAGVLIGVGVCKTRDELNKRAAIEAGVAQYNSVTGKFEFKNFKGDQTEGNQ